MTAFVYFFSELSDSQEVEYIYSTFLFCSMTVVLPDVYSMSETLRLLSPALSKAM